ncbi:hypothetical protein Trydic_g22859 [Trypoxylus dichotomus]
MKFIIAVSLFLTIATAEILEPAAQNLEKEASFQAAQQSTNNAALNLQPDTLDEKHQPPLLSVPAESQDKRPRQQRNVLIKTEIPTLVVPTYEIPQFYVLVDQPHYAPWYYYPASPSKEKPEETKQ